MFNSDTGTLSQLDRPERPTCYPLVLRLCQRRQFYHAAFCADKTDADGSEQRDGGVFIRRNRHIFAYSFNPTATMDMDFHRTSIPISFLKSGVLF